MRRGVLLVLMSLAPSVAGADCPDVDELRTMGIELYRYLPDWSPAREDLQFVYTSGILARRGNDHTAVRTALDSLARKLLVEQDNIYGAPRSDFALLYDLYRVCDAFPYPYGHEYYRSHGGGHFLLENGPPESMSHVDVVLTTTEEGKRLAQRRCSPRLPHKGEYGGIRGFPSDDGESVGSNENGIVVRGIPVGPDVDGYQSLLHELGHVIELNDGITRTGVDLEARAEVARVVLANPPDRRAWRGYEVPYHGTFVLTRKTSRRGVADDLGHSVRWMGQLWLAYLAEHYHGGTPRDPLDDLLHDYLTPRGSRRQVDMSMFGLAALLDETRYQDVPRPQLADGEARLERLFHDFGIALALNVPSIEDGQWGFPLHYQPTAHLPLFQDAGDSPNRAGIPPEFTVGRDDVGRVREIRGPIHFDDGSTLDLQMFSWCQEIFVVHVDEAAVAAGARGLRIRVVGDPLPADAAPPFSAARPFRHSLSASMGTLAELDDRPFWDAADRVLDVVPLPVHDGPEAVEVTGVMPLASARTAVVVMSLAERGMASNMPRERRSAPWRYHVQLSLENATP